MYKYKTLGGILMGSATVLIIFALVLFYSVQFDFELWDTEKDMNVLVQRISFSGLLMMFLGILFNWRANIRAVLVHQFKIGTRSEEVYVMVAARLSAQKIKYLTESNNKFGFKITHLMVDENDAHNAMIMVRGAEHELDKELKEVE